MFRTIFTLALSMFLLAEASAQTTPATTKKASAKATARTTRRAAKKARKVAIKSAPVAPALNDGWPAIEETQTAVASTTTAANNGWGAATAGSSNRGEIDNANVYASPGMPVHIRTSNGMVPYSVRPPRKSAATTQTTLGN
ncbi:hypothetical protein [Hymenobacter sp. UYCo722]|uniref:hypothetical protein n=1 Tax=Hymenobacter sp. UYCo722 TaxID=3156335 RepID=UPI00339B1839